MQRMSLLLGESKEGRLYLASTGTGSRSSLLSHRWACLPAAPPPPPPLPPIFELHVIPHPGCHPWPFPGHAGSLTSSHANTHKDEGWPSALSQWPLPYRHRPSCQPRSRRRTLPAAGAEKPTRPRRGRRAGHVPPGWSGRQTGKEEHSQYQTATGGTCTGRGGHQHRCTRALVLNLEEAGSISQGRMQVQARPRLRRVVHEPGPHGAAFRC